MKRVEIRRNVKACKLTNFRANPIKAQPSRALSGETKLCKSLTLELVHGAVERSENSMKNSLMAKMWKNYTLKKPRQAKAELGVEAKFSWVTGIEKPIQGGGELGVKAKPKLVHDSDRGRKRKKSTQTCNQVKRKKKSKEIPTLADAEYSKLNRPSGITPTKRSRMLSIMNPKTNYENESKISNPKISSPASPSRSKNCSKIVGERGIERWFRKIVKPRRQICNSDDQGPCGP